MVGWVLVLVLLTPGGDDAVLEKDYKTQKECEVAMKDIGTNLKTSGALKHVKDLFCEERQSTEKGEL